MPRSIDEIQKVHIVSSENALFIDEEGNFYYHIDSFVMGEYSGYNFGYVIVYNTKVKYETYCFMGYDSIIDVHLGKDDSPSDPNIMELDICV